MKSHSYFAKYQLIRKRLWHFSKLFSYILRKPKTKYIKRTYLNVHDTNLETSNKKWKFLTASLKTTVFMSVTYTKYSHKIYDTRWCLGNSIIQRVYSKAILFHPPYFTHKLHQTVYITLTLKLGLLILEWSNAHQRLIQNLWEQRKEKYTCIMLLCQTVLEFKTTKTLQL